MHKALRNVVPPHFTGSQAVHVKMACVKKLPSCNPLGFLLFLEPSVCPSHTVNIATECGLFYLLWNLLFFNLSSGKRAFTLPILIIFQLNVFYSLPVWNKKSCIWRSVCFCTGEHVLMYTCGPWPGLHNKTISEYSWLMPILMWQLKFHRRWLSMNLKIRSHHQSSLRPALFFSSKCFWKPWVWVQGPKSSVLQTEYSLQIVNIQFSSSPVGGGYDIGDQAW